MSNRYFDSKDELAEVRAMPASKLLKPEKPIKFDDAMRHAMRVPPPPKKNKQRKVWRKKRR